MDIVKLREVRIGTIIGMRQCIDASRYYEEPESSMYMYNDRPIVKGEYDKCRSCAYRHKKQCGKIACMSFERKDGKSVIMEKF